MTETETRPEPIAGPSPEHAASTLPVADAPPSAVVALLGRRGLLSFLPTRRLALLLLIPVPLLILGGGGGVPAAAAIAADVVLIAAAVFEALRLPGRDDVAIRRIEKPVLSLGARARLETVVRLRPGSPPALGVVLQDDLPQELHPVARPAPVDLAPEEEQVLATEIVPVKRGVYRLGTLHVRFGGPLGLALRQHSWVRTAAVQVVPNLAGVARYRLLARRGRLREIGLRHLRLRGAGTSFESLREHVAGDDPRRVDWKATARRGFMVARNYEVERSQSVVLIVDAGRHMTAEVEHAYPRLEYALNAAMVLAHVAVSRDDRVGALVFAAGVQGFVPPTRGRGALERVTRVLAAAEGRLVEPDVEAAFRHLSARGRKRSLMVLFTEVVDADTSAAVLAHVARAAGRHLALVVTLRDHALEAAARGDADDGRPWRRAAAEELLHAREQALQVLRRRGVSVLDVPPKGLTAAVIDRYLELKARLLI